MRLCHLGRVPDFRKRRPDKKSKTRKRQGQPVGPAERKNSPIRDTGFPFPVKETTPRDSVIYAAYTSTLAEMGVYKPELVLFPPEKDGSGFITASSVFFIHNSSVCDLLVKQPT